MRLAELKLLFILFNIILPTPHVVSAMGLGEWQRETAYGNLIQDGCLKLKNDTNYIYISAWYFYKGCIVAEDREENKFWVVNEVTKEKYQFHGKKDWEDFIEARVLRPNFWTRWHTDVYDWVWYESCFSYIFITLLLAPLTSFFVFAMMAYICWVVMLSLRYLQKKHQIIIATFVVLCIVLRYYLDIAPQSF